MNEVGSWGGGGKEGEGKIVGGEDGESLKDVGVGEKKETPIGICG